MAPSAVETVTQEAEKLLGKTDKTEKTDGPAQTEQQIPKEVYKSHREPLKLSGALDRFRQFDVTPVIGREFVDVDLAEWLRAPNSDELLRDLAITVSRRGVVFFRKQDNISDDLQKELVQRLGELSGKPETSKLHIHPLNNSGREDGSKDDEISVISSVQAKKLFSKSLGFSTTQSLKDTLWASGYELYDRISPPLRGFLETLVAHFAQPGFQKSAEKNNFKLHPGPRGAPENVGEILEAFQPVIRTNPVTGWKSVYAVGHHVASIVGLSEAESKHFLDWFLQILTESHDIQVRLRWQNVNDVAIWDNRSVYHAATPDYIDDEDLGERKGSRSVSLGERPYLDPQSVSRREGLAAEKAAASNGKA
ncbi:hypothetical protein A1O3_07565 [Capronia epimyces CBS 606.96]|uniref:TauD/TfdA-like domain-containing protein n=1 Tax=Capronia epimyces CBS 606.96 TaxID=1182542 RepID=W9XV99_9EURO|nr:uncharacterized protein A1O3_07565 [Capronia epimyces CBS 606.96]EXJ81275.1 hypothetical protein A1O3_07565 [Capronia epimyces CBS 606.96]